jgi:hypothetical protein
MKRHLALLASLGLVAAACGSQEQGPTTTTDWESGEEEGDDSSDSASSASQGSADDGETGFDPICLPGSQVCADDGSMDICAETGLEWLNEPCPTYTACKACVGEDDPLCEGRPV